MRKQSRIANTLTVGGFVGVVSSVFALATGWGVAAFAVILSVMSLIPTGASGACLFGVTPQIWLAEVVGNIFKENEFINYSVDWSNYVVGGTILHIPQAGTPSKTERNRTNTPATVVHRADKDITMALDEFTTDPRKISDAEKVELSYDKMASAVAEDKASLIDTVGDWFCYYWRPAAKYFLRTTGSSVAAHLDGATGNRKRLTVADFKAAKTMISKSKVKGERYALLDDDMFSQLCDDLAITSQRDFSAVYDPTTGTIKKLESFNILLRSTVLVASNASTPVILTPEENTTATSNGVVLCWAKDAVGRAPGEEKMFGTENDPQHYGDIYSFLKRAGGRKRYEDGKGVVGIIQAAA